ncbi:MAG: MmgE/PrpD family protein [Dehalococcoidia bacterium]
MMVEVTKRYAEFIVNTRLEDIPEAERTLAKGAILDGVGVTIAATTEPAGRMILDYVRDLGGAEQASVVGGGYKTNAANAAYANGTLAHCLDFDDVGGFGHPTVVLLPAILALGERLGKSGRDALEAYCIGFEVAANLALGNKRQNVDQIRGFHSTAALGHFAAASASAKLLGLDVEQTQRTLGIAASGSAGVLANLGYHVKPLHAGQAGRNGVTAAELAKRGWTASPDVIERPVGWAYAFLGAENFDAERATATLGTEWRLPASLGIKKYPCCYYNHAALDGLLKLLKDNEVAFDDVEVAQLEVPTLLPFFHAEPTTAFQGKFSYEYNLAAAILDHEIVQDTFTDEKATSPGMVEALKRSKVVAAPEKFSASTARTAPVSVRTRSGKEYNTVVDVPYGHAAAPLKQEEIVAKFRKNAARLLDGGDTDRLLGLLLNLESSAVPAIMAIAGSRAVARV